MKITDQEIADVVRICDRIYLKVNEILKCLPGGHGGPNDFDYEDLTFSFNVTNMCMGYCDTERHEWPYEWLNLPTEEVVAIITDATRREEEQRVINNERRETARKRAEYERLKKEFDE